MSFDSAPDRRGTGCAKWDQMEEIYGVAAEDGLAMWVADMDFQAPDPVRAALREMAEHGVLGYPGRDDAYLDAVRWWMAHRHGWEVAREAIFSANGLVNAVALCLDVWTEPGDEIVLFTPVYHAFARVIRAAGRRVVECPMLEQDGRYAMDLDGYDALVGPRARMAILCSPQNPGGTVWRRDELTAVADFVRRHDLMLISDEVHQDLVFSGVRHLPTALAAPELRDRLVVLTAPTKTFNIAGTQAGQVILEDAQLQAQFRARLRALGLKPNAFALRLTEAAYTPEGAAWCDALVAYLDANRQLFESAVGAIPGVRPMPLQATFLAWVDFAGTGLAADAVTERVERRARIAVNLGPTFGRGGESFLRFNIGAPRAVVAEAAARLADAFSDLS